MICLYKEYSIGIKKLSDAELNRESSLSGQTHIGLSEKVLTFLPNIPEQREGILVYNKSCTIVECAFSKIANKRSPKIDSQTTNPVKSVVKQIRNIASNDSLDWYIVWFAIDLKIPVFWLLSSNSSEYRELSSIVNLDQQTCVYKASNDEFFFILSIIRQLNKLDAIIKNKYSNSLHNRLIATSSEHRTFVHLCLDYFRGEELLNNMIPYFNTDVNNSPIQITKPNKYKLINMFIFADKQEIANRNTPRKRWYTDPFIVNGRSLYLYVDWYPGKDTNGVDMQLMVPHFAEFIKDCFGNKYVYRNNQGEHELWFVDSPEFFFPSDILVSNSTLFPKNTEDIKQIPFSIQDVIVAIKSTGLIYSSSLIKRFVFSLMSKPFVILSGLAGSGKTQLALAFASAMVEDRESQLCMVSVGADWTNREPLLGFPNALQPGKYVRPESKVLDLLIAANKPENAQKPYFLILDEMNMSYVERYFADFLSAMESHEQIALWNVKEDDADYDNTPKSVALPKNLFIIGTINVDETTYMFSPKVLDRANVIEFKISSKEMLGFLKNVVQIDRDSINSQCAGMGADFIQLSAAKDLAHNDTVVSKLGLFFDQLKRVNAEFGYRSATEIFRFISLAQKNDNTDDKMDLSWILDAAIVQKLLPKLHGSRKKLEPVLQQLWRLCFDDAMKDTIAISRDNVEKAIYKESADKIQRMYDAAYANGFTSFAEA